MSEQIAVNEIEVNGVEYVRKDCVEETKCVPTYKGLPYCTVRTYSAGVFAGYIDRKSVTDGCGTVYLARRLWYWKGAASLSQLAEEGVKCPGECKFPREVSEVDLHNIVEVIPCSDKAKKSIAEVKVWEQ